MPMVGSSFGIRAERRLCEEATEPDASVALLIAKARCPTT
jgi:hypothetical protein